MKGPERYPRLDVAARYTRLDPIRRVISKRPKGRSLSAYNPYERGGPRIHWLKVVRARRNAEVNGGWLSGFSAAAR